MWSLKYIYFNTKPLVKMLRSSSGTRGITWREAYPTANYLIKPITTGHNILSGTSGSLVGQFSLENGATVVLMRGS